LLLGRYWLLNIWAGTGIGFYPILDLNSILPWYWYWGPKLIFASMMQVYTWDWDWYSPSMKLLLPQVVTGQEYWYKASIYPCHACFGFHWNWQSICLCFALHVFVSFSRQNGRAGIKCKQYNAAFLFSCLPRCPIKKMSGEALIHIVAA